MSDLASIVQALGIIAVGAMVAAIADRLDRGDRALDATIERGNVAGEDGDDV